ncbi:GAF domain-containing protein, partial [Escherichia coli]|nr:GAF domain-containing protein [Escherichia coli]
MNKTEFYADLNTDFNAPMAGDTRFLATLSNPRAVLNRRPLPVNGGGFFF